MLVVSSVLKGNNNSIEKKRSLSFRANALAPLRPFMTKSYEKDCFIDRLLSKKGSKVKKRLEIAMQEFPKSCNDGSLDGKVAYQFWGNFLNSLKENPKQSVLETLGSTLGKSKSEYIYGDLSFVVTQPFRNVLLKVETNPSYAPFLKKFYGRLHKQYGPKPIKEPKINPQLVDIRLNSAENLQSAPRIKAKTDGDLLVEAYEKLEKQKTNFIEVKEKRKSATVVSESKTEVRAQIKEYTDRLNSNYIELNDLELQSSSHKVKAQMGILNQEQAILRAQIKGLKRELGTLLRKERASR